MKMECRRYGPVVCRNNLNFATSMGATEPENKCYNPSYKVIRHKVINALAHNGVLVNEKTK